MTDTRLKIQLDPALEAALRREAAAQERSIAAQVRHLLRIGLWSIPADEPTQEERR